MANAALANDVSCAVFGFYVRVTAFHKFELVQNGSIN